MSSSESRACAEAGPNKSLSKPFSISLGTKPRKAQLLNVTPRKRPRAAGLAEDSDSEGEGRNNEPQLVSSFDHAAGGAIATTGGNKEAKAPLVISSQKNRDWRAEARRKQGKNLLPAEEQARREGRVLPGQNLPEGRVEEEEKPVYGLVIKKKADDDNQGQPVDAGTAATENSVGEPAALIAPPRKKTADEEALEALTGENKKESTLVIEGAHVADDRFAPRVSETNAFREDVASRPDMAPVSVYDAVPIEEFGRALIRGMGWKEGEEIGRRKGAVIKQREIKRRPGLLGIGAKEAPEGLEELGAWGNGTKKTGGKMMDTSFTPLLLKNKKTGELITEEEARKRQENSKFVEDDWRDRRDGKIALVKTNNKDNYSSSSRPDKEDRERHQERRKDREGGRSSRHNRSYSPEPDRSAKERERDRNQNRDRDPTRRKRDYDSTDDRRRKDRDRERERERDIGRKGGKDEDEEEEMRAQRRRRQRQLEEREQTEKKERNGEYSKGKDRDRERDRRRRDR